MSRRSDRKNRKAILSWLMIVVVLASAFGGWHWLSNRAPAAPAELAVVKQTSAKSESFDLPAGKWQMAMNPEALKELGLGGNTNILTNGLDFSRLEGITDPKEMEVELNWLIDDYIKSIKPSAATLLGYAKELGIPEAKGVELNELLEEFTVSNGEVITISSDKAVAIAEALRVKMVTDAKKLDHVTNGHNTGIDETGKLVYDKNTNITGNTKAILFTGKNGEKYALLERCGNLVFKEKPEDIPPGVIEQITPDPDPDPILPKKYIIYLTKFWQDFFNKYGSRPDSIKVNLYRYDPTAAQTIVLLETATVKGNKNSGEWSFQFKGRYPKLTAGAYYYVTEDYVRNYEASNNNVVTFSGDVGQVSITNSLIPGDGGLQPKSNDLRDYGAIQGAQPAQTTQLTTPPVDNKPQKGESSILDKVTAPAPNLTAPGAADESAKTKKEQDQPAHTNVTKSPDGDVNKDITDNVGDTTAPVTAPNDIPDSVAGNTTPDPIGENSSVGSNPNDGAPVDFGGDD